MDYFETIPDFDPEWMADIEAEERRIQDMLEEVELMPHRGDFNTEKDWLEAVAQYEFEQDAVPFSNVLNEDWE